MSASGNIQQIKEKLRAYKRKYYVNLLIKGSIFSLSIILSVFLLFNTLEFALNFKSPVRAVLFFSFIIAFLTCFYFWVLIPLLKLLRNEKQISDEEAARQIGQYFPNINDKLLNTIQLGLLSYQENSLIAASIEQRTKDINVVPFTDAVKFSQNRKFLKYLIAPAAVVLVLLIFIPQLLTQSTARIINFEKDYVPEAPFDFLILNESLDGFKNEDFTLKVGFDGSSIPDQAYLIIKGRRIKLKKNAEQEFEHTFQKLQASSEFYLEAAGYNSSLYELNIYTRPNLKNFNVYLDYPGYIGKKDETLINVGNLQIPEGTSVKWQLSTIESDSMTMYFESEDKVFDVSSVDDELFEFEKQILRTDRYQIALKNPHSSNKEKITYQIEVRKDEYPAINLEQFKDTVLFNYLILGGSITDDYGLSQLKLNYTIKKGREPSGLLTYNIPIQKYQTNQSFFYQWRFDSLDLTQGDQIEYHLAVYDNDGVNGRKVTRTSTYYFKVPTREEVVEKIQKESEGTEKQIGKTLQEAEELQERIKELEERLKSKKELDWQDENLLKELLEQREKLNEELSRLKEQNLANSQQRERFNEYDEKISKKVEDLQKLMDELLDDETKKLYEELRKLLEDQHELNEVQDALDDIQNKEENLEKELERALELFKRMKMEYQLEETIDQLEELAEEQEELAEQTGDEQNSLDELSEEQQELQEKFEDIQESIDEINEMNQELESPAPIQDMNEEMQDISQEQQQSQENMQQNDREGSQQNQQKASDKMREMSEQMQMMQSSMQMNMLQENLDNLEDIVDNLVKLSFDQEELMNEFRNVNQNDPRFMELAQKQLKLKDDAKIIEDSLTALANRVFQIASFVTRELKAMNNSIDGSMEALRDRNKAQAVSKQQFSMTSMNNLALLLDDVLQQMQQQMADAMGNPRMGKDGQKKNMPGLSDLQQQLNKKIDDLKKSGKTGRQLSEELAKLAAEQEYIRQQLQEMQEQLDQQGEGAGGSAEPLIQKMEDTELDLVNKRITEETINRQREILTRLLEAEESMRERELDNEREAEQASEIEREVPPAFEEYIKEKEKEIELLKTVPPKLNPYYKKEVNDYFRRIGGQ